MKKGTSRYLGDVIVGEQIIGYEPGKQKSEGIDRRYEAYRPAKELVEAARRLAHNEWLSLIQTLRPDGSTGRILPQVHFGVVASGEKVVADAQFAHELQSDWSQLVGIEMEGMGTALAAYEGALPGALLVKGICDWADNTKNDDWQAYAADAAASFVIALLMTGPFERRAKEQPIRKEEVTLTATPSSSSVVNQPPREDPYSGKVKIRFGTRLGQSWQELADYFEIPPYQRTGFPPGREPQKVWEWLEERQKLSELKVALKFIRRDDLLALFDEQL